MDEWMIANQLKLNTDKTETLIVKTKNHFDNQVIDSIIISPNADVAKGTIKPSPAIKSLGILFDENLSFEDQVNVTIQSCYINLRNLRAIGSKLNFKLKKQLIHCLIFFKNGLL